MKNSFKKYFIPNEENNHQPHFLREKFAVSILAFSLFLLLASILGSHAVQNSKFLASIQSAFLVDLANEDRILEGAGTLVINEKLVAAAQLKADDMARKSYFAHVSPEGVTPWHWFGEAKYSYIYAGENLAVNFSNSEDVQKAWMNSPTHRANILNNRYKEIGIATAQGIYKGKNTTFVVQMFGTQSSLVASAASSSQSISSAPETNTLADVVASAGLAPQVEGDSVVASEAMLESEEKDQPSGSDAKETQTKTEENSAPEEETEAQTQTRTQSQSEEPVVENVETFAEASTEIQTESSFIETVNPLYENQIPENENIAVTEGQSSSPQVYTNWFERFLVSPGDAVNKAYVILFVIILFSLILKIFISISHQHPKNIAYGILLLILVLIFMYINQEIFSSPVIASI